MQSGDLPWRDLPWRDLPSPRLTFVRDTVLSLPFSPTSFALGFLLRVKEQVPGERPPWFRGARVLRTGSQNRRFRRVPQGSLNISLYNSLKVP